MSSLQRCAIFSKDRWKPRAYPGRKWFFVVAYFGGNEMIMRLFDDAKSQRYYVRRVKRFANGWIESTGCITWKVPAPAPWEMGVTVAAGR